MKRRIGLIAALAFVAAMASLDIAGSSASIATSQDQKSSKQEKLARQAKITEEQARETALKRAPGTVEQSELEREHGQLVYSFDIRNAKGTITEVQVSAITGKVVRVEHESKAQEEAEKKKEKQEKN
jgi:uncharacterized membrane protein YkoI